MDIRAIATIAFFAFTLAIHSQTSIVEENKPAASKKYPFNGMGRVILKSADINTTRQPYLTQADFTSANTVYVICYDYRLACDIVIPEGCILQFDGGSISGKYIITGTNTGINAPLVTILGTDISLAGTWNLREAYPEWFGAKGDGVSDDADAIQKSFEFRCPVYLQCKVYGVNKSIELAEASTISSCTSELNVLPGSLIYSTPDYTSKRGCIKALSKITGVLWINGVGVSIKNVAIDGNDKIADSGIGQDRSLYKSRIIIENCYIYNCKIGISLSIYLSELSNNTCDQCEVGFRNESGKSATMTSLSLIRNYAKNCSVGYRFVGLIYSNFLNNACDKCLTGVVLSRVRCCNFLANGFEDVKRLYLLSDYCDALDFNGVICAMEKGGDAFFAEKSFYGSFSVRNLKAMNINKINSLINISGNKEPTMHSIVHVDRSINKFLCKGYGNFIFVESEKNLLDSINLRPCSVNTEDILSSDNANKYLYKIANGAYYLESFKPKQGTDSRLIYELAEITLDPGDYLFGGFITSDQNVQEGVTCVLSKGEFTNNTFVSTRHNSGCFSIGEKTTLHVNLLFQKTAKVPSMIIAPYITKVN